MKKLFLSTFILGLFVFISCKNDETHADETPDYHIEILSPNTDAKHVGDTISVIVNFEDHHKGTVHHINIRMYNKVTGDQFFSIPSEAHVHETDGLYEFSELKVLAVPEHTDWILVAKVWGHDDGLHEVRDSIEFHVHP